MRKAADTLKTGVWDYMEKGSTFQTDSFGILFPEVFEGNQTEKEAEHALSESRDRYMSIFNTVNDGIILLDFETKASTDYNPRVLELFELSERTWMWLKIERILC